MESDSVYLPVHGTMKEPAVPLQSQGSTRPKSKKLFQIMKGDQLAQLKRSIPKKNSTQLNNIYVVSTST